MSRPRRVLHFAQDGDTSGFFPQLARRHDRDRFQMLFATLRPIAPWLREVMESEGVSCLSCDCRSQAEYPAGLVRLARFLRRQQVDIVHTHLFEPSVVGLHAGVLAGTPARVMTRHHSDYHTRIGKTWHVRLDRLCTRLSHHAIAVSQHTADHLVGVESAPPEKISVVLNGIDFERVRLSSPEAPQRIRAEFGAEGAHLLLVAARLHAEKGHTYLFQALQEIQRNVDRPVLLLVAGLGTAEANANYRAEVRALGCEGMVRFLGFRNDLPDLMAAADLFVLPSVAEAFGLVLAEALQMGTPVVATRVGGIPEIIDDGVSGVLVRPGDSRSLAGAVSGLLNDAARRRGMAGRGREKIVTRFSFPAMVLAYEAIYDRLVADAGWCAEGKVGLSAPP